MTDMEILFIVVFAVGIVLLLSAFFKKSAGPLKGLNPVLAGALGVLMIIPGFYYGIMPLMPETETPTQTIVIPETTATVPTFTVEMQRNTTGFQLNSTLSSDSTELTWPFTVNAKDNTADKTTTTEAVPCRATFVITPIAPTGSTTLTLATIYYSITPTQVETQTDRYLLIRDVNTKTPLVNFTSQIKGTSGTKAAQMGEGSTSMTLTDTGEVWLDMIFQNSTIAKYWSTLSSVTFTVTFRNADYSWSDSFTIRAIKIADAAA